MRNDNARCLQSKSRKNFVKSQSKLKISKNASGRTKGMICSRTNLFKAKESCALGKRAVRYLGDFLLKLLKAFRLHSCIPSSQSPAVSFLLVPASTASPVQLRKGGTLNSTERATRHKFNNKDLFPKSVMIRLCASAAFSAHL